MKDNKGSVILYAVFLMMALSATAILTAFVILTSIRYTSNSTHATSAFYAAESGIENSLYKIRDYRDTRGTVVDAVADINDDSGTLSNGADYSVDADHEYIDSLSFDLPMYSSKQVDVFDPDTAESLLSATGTIIITWHKAVGCTDAADLELSIKSFTNSSWEDSLDTGIGEGTYKLYCATSCTNNAYSLQSGYSHKIKLKPVYCDLVIDSITISSGGSDITFRNYIKIVSTGEMGTATFPMQAETIWKPPLSGLGEFVLFSEDTITK
jgi:hypothetical protein